MTRQRPPEYIAWANAVQRCHNPKHPTFNQWGGRGIKVCDEWRASFGAFLAHIGSKPEPRLQLERIDNGRGYEPGNVRWATPREQSSNTRRNRYIEIDGVSLTIAEWSRRFGADDRVVGKRIARGWDAMCALKEPVQCIQG